MKPEHYGVVGQKVMDYVDAWADDDVYDEFYDLLEVLMEHGPYPDDQPGMGILPLQDDTRPNGFTAPFDAGLLAYQVLRDFPLIKLVDAFWLNEDEGDEGLGYAF